MQSELGHNLVELALGGAVAKPEVSMERLDN